LPSVNRLYEEFKGQGLEVLLISFRESADVVKQAVTERGYTAPVLLDASGDVTGRTYGVFGPPTAYLVDREGLLVGRLVGARDWSGPAARDLIRAFVTTKPR
jgi:peroxiredoxin